VLIDLINSEELTADNIKDKLSIYDGILVGPGFGNRGIEGKLLSAKYARENKIPFFGIALGMQCACIDFARNICGIANATFLDCVPEGNENDFVIDIFEELKGSSMRLGSYPCFLKDNTIVAAAYKEGEMSERHRHSYEFNNKYKELFSENGIIFSGLSPNDKLVEIIELKDHP